MRPRKYLASFLVTAAILSACSQQQTSKNTENTTNQTSESLTISEASSAANTSDDSTTLTATATESSDAELSEYYGKYEEEDLVTEYDGDSTTTITLGDTSEVDGDGAEVSDSTVTITKGGTYVVSGTLSQGQLVVNAGKEEKVYLILDGVNITNSSGPAIDIEQAEKVITTLTEGSENTLTDGTDYQLADGATEPDAAFYSKEDLTINGTGSLTVTGNYSNGIRGKDDVVLVSGTYQITAKNNAIKGKDSVSIRGGEYTITTAEGDGIQANNAEDTTKGWVAIDGGTFTINSGRDGIQAETTLKTQNTEMTIKTADGANSGSLDAEESYKGLKATTDLIVTDGTYTIDAVDDSIHANGTVTIDGGTLQLASGDDGIHADNKLTFNDGQLTISQSYEGLEAAELYFNGGVIEVTAQDDGVNAGGGSDTDETAGQFGGDTFGGGGPGGGDQADETKFIEMAGGTLLVNADGDGVDSNGNITMTGGTMLVNGPTNGGNGALDYNGTFDISGGTLMAAGSTGMALNVSDTSTQTALAVTFDSSQAADTLISLTDSEGNLITAFQPTKSFQHLVISTPDLATGTVNLASGGTASTLSDQGLATTDTTITDSTTLSQLTLSETVSSLSQSGEAVSSGMGMGGGMGGPGGF